MNKFFKFLGLTKRAGNLIEGYSKCDEQRNRIKIYLFILSKDASDSTVRKFTNHCNINKIKMIEDFTKEELGASIGREEVKIIAITDENMAKKLCDLYEKEKEEIEKEKI